MDQDLNPSSVSLDTEHALTNEVERQRANADQFFAQERERMEAIEASLLQQFNLLASQVAQLKDGADLTSDLAAVEEELQRRREAVKSVESEFINSQDELNAIRAELDERADELLQKQDRLNQLSDRLAHDEEVIETKKEATRQQRTRIVEQLKRRRTEFLQELDQRREQIEQLNNSSGDQFKKSLEEVVQQRDDLSQQRDAAIQERDELSEQRDGLLEERDATAQERDALGQERDAIGQERDDIAQQCEAQIQQREELVKERDELAQQHDELTQQRDELTQQRDELTQQRDELAQQRDELAQQRDELTQQRDELAQQRAELAKERDDIAGDRDRFQQALEELQCENQQLNDKLADAESKKQHKGSAADDELQNRLDGALQEIDLLNQQNAELERTIQESPSEMLATPSSDFDWEAQKRQMFNLDSGEGPAMDETQRIDIADTIRLTDKIVATKDQKIKQLQDELENQKADAARAELPQPERQDCRDVDADELVQQERAKLDELQVSMREKMRVTEVELSLERAKLAREKAAVQEKLEDLELTIEKRISEIQANNDGKVRKTTSRWRTRLGLDKPDD